MSTIKSGIYLIKNISNNKIYVGSALNISNRFSTHKYKLKNQQHKNPHLQAAWNKYGESSFEFSILEIVEDQNLLIKREQYYINLYNCCDKQVGYNIAKIAGSTLGIKASEETKKKQSIAAKNRVRTPFSKETIEKRILYYKENRVKPPFSKITFEQAKEIRQLYQDNVPVKDISVMYNIRAQHVSDIIRNLYWKDDSYTYIKRKKNK